MENINITHEECEFIRSLSDWDLEMLLSEINDLGWKRGKELIPMMREALPAKED